MLFKFDAFYYFVGGCVDVVEYAAAYDCVDCFVFALPDGINWAARFEDCFRLACLSRGVITVTFQVLIVLS